MMRDYEKSYFESVVHGLRMRGWSRIDAEGEALDRIERSRARAALATPEEKK
jgi:hypothetical protein